MKRKQVFVLILIVTVPLCLLAWAGLRLVENEQRVLEQRMRALLSERLRDIDRSVVDHFADLARELQQYTAIDDYDPAELRERIRGESRVLQLFVIAPNGDLLHPNPIGTLNEAEREFLAQGSQFIIDRDLQRAAESQLENGGGAAGGTQDLTSDAASVGSPAKSKQATPVTPTSGWYAWYWARGLNLVYWHRRPSGHIVGAALNRARWIADLIAALPDTPAVPTGVDLNASMSRIRMINSTSQPVYQWGPYEPAEDAEPASEITLSPPLNAWRLQQFLPRERLAASAGTAVYFNLGVSLSVAAAGLIALGWYFYREYARDMHEASRRVSFVNQVSHELRTPLTNIRLYADLLDTDLEKLPEDISLQPKNRLQVILSESQRLSRLIGNVLTFARQQRKALKLNLRSSDVDRIVGDVLERFRPALDQQGIEIEFAGSATGNVLVDADVVEQILGNLVNNVEKYASDGHWLGVRTEQDHGRTTIFVADRGPGIRREFRTQVFQPFWRGSDSLHQAAGTGIGLTIVRELARLHGGDVTLLDSEEGAVFRVELATPPAQQEDEL